MLYEEVNRPPTPPVNNDDEAGGNSALQAAAAARIKIQPFYENDPELWFAIIESQFVTRLITSDKTKYYTTVGMLPHRVADRVKTLIKSGYVPGNYNVLKEKLIKEFAETSAEKMKKLLSQLTLGDQKPSQLLQQMRTLANDTVTDEFMRSLWMQRLPKSIKQIISASNDPLDTLAEMADRIWETADETPISAASSNIPTQRQTPESSVLEKIADQLDKITQRLERLERPSRREARRDNTPANRERSSSNNRRQNQQPRSNSQANGKRRFDLCWYHHAFGDDATKCTEPCNFVTQKN